jgi:hypothetical protein
MKKLIALVVLGLILIACNGCGASKSAPTQAWQPPQLAGSWTITVVQNKTTLNTLQAVLVQVPVGADCKIPPLLYGPMTGDFCYVADNSTGRGSVSGTGSFIYPPEGVVVGFWTNTSTFLPGTTQSVNASIVFGEADTLGDSVTFDADATITGSSSMSGTWQCGTTSTVCSGMSGTFSGTKK